MESSSGMIGESLDIGSGDAQRSEMKLRLYEALKECKAGAGDFACGGKAKNLPLNPGLYIDEVGIVSLPLLKEQAEKIIAVAKKAPYGLGEKTLLDESVRKSWQLEPSQIQIKNGDFPSGVHSLVGDVKKLLGCGDVSVMHKLYKVLLYEDGGHFKAHQDTEKERGMFATLIIQLPSIFEGGKLIVRHAGREKEIQMDGEEAAYSCIYAAHYSDCKHELSEVRNGYRLALVYSLSWVGKNKVAPTATVRASAAEKLSTILMDFNNARNGEKFAWFLSHQYTYSALEDGGMMALKRDDAAVAGALLAASNFLPPEEQFEFHITQVTRQLDQYGECYGWDEFEATGDEEEHILMDREWFGFDGSTPAMPKFGTLDMEEEVINYICPAGTDWKDYGEKFWGKAMGEENTGPSGNEGATQSYWYKPYAIFAWQKKNTIKVMCEDDLGPVVGRVGEDASQVMKLDKTDPKYQQAMANLKQVIDFAARKDVTLSSMTKNVICPLLDILSEIKDIMLVQSFITGVLVKEFSSSSWYSYSRALYPFCSLYRGTPEKDEMTPKLVHLITVVGWQSVSGAVTALFHECPLSQFKRWITLVDRLLEEFDVNREEFIQFGRKAIDHLYSSLETGKWKEIGKSQQTEILSDLLQTQSKHPEFDGVFNKFVKQDVVTNDVELLRNLISHFKENQNEDEVPVDDHIKTLLGYVVDETEKSIQPGKLNHVCSHATTQSVIKTTKMLFSIGDSPLLQKFVNTVIHAGNEDLLLALLENVESSAVRDDPHWLMLVNARVQQLEILEKQGPPPFSWCQENATLDGHPQVEEFLRGPLETYKYKAFANIAEARNWANRYFRYSGSASGTAQVGNGDKQASVVIRKTKKFHDQKVAKYQTDMRELARLRSSLKRKLVDDCSPELPAKKQASEN